MFLKFQVGGSILNNEYNILIIGTHGNVLGQNRESSLWIANEDFEIRVMLKI